MANIVDYQGLQQAKANSEKKFDEMLQNLDSMKSQIESMSSDSWKGQSSNVFNEEIVSSFSIILFFFNALFKALYHLLSSYI